MTLKYVLGTARGSLNKNFILVILNNYFLKMTLYISLNHGHIMPVILNYKGINLITCIGIINTDEQDVIVAV